MTKMNSFLLFSILLMIGCRNATLPQQFEETTQKPAIYPDYSNITIPPNIAPMNFSIQEEGDRFLTKISAGSESLLLTGKTVDIPLPAWKKMLLNNIGKNICFDIFVQKNNKWTKFQSITNKITENPIDPWLSYRLIAPGYEHYSFLGLFQRNLETFKETPFFRGNLVDEKTCTNCHNYQNRKTDNFLFHTRISLGGTVFVTNGEAVKIETKTDETGGACVYPSWHPDLPLVAFSVNNTVQIFHSLSLDKIEVLDTFSDLVLYDVEKHAISRILPKSDDSFETFPSWAPDGRTLYYCVAHLDLKVPRENKTERKKAALKHYSDFKYNLMKIPFDPATRTFGEPELVIDAAAIDKSVLFPRVSPDGKSLLYTLSKYGTFPIWHPDSDLWLLNLQTGENQPLNDVNSCESESFHNWDSTGNWFVFSSRRDDGSYTRLYFTHKNQDGSFSKPFLLPQKDPEQNIVLMKSYNIPELMTEPIDISIVELARAARVPDPPKATFISEQEKTAKK
ncbi:MAG: hypothetical protein Q4C95_09670 [Planctomycetia bacterium]|nr:hypothetical protein [Planctomycetia bacterium]